MVTWSFIYMEYDFREIKRTLLHTNEVWSLKFEFHESNSMTFSRDDLETNIEVCDLLLSH